MYRRCIMEIFRTFIFEQSTHDVHIVLKDGEPIFRANDVGKVLDIKNIRSSTQNFTHEEKVVHTMDTLGGDQDILYLTETGLLRLIFNSRKSIAQPFKQWVLKVMKSIGKTGEYKLRQEVLENQITEMERKLIDTVDLERHKNLVELCANRCIVYFGKIQDETDGTMLIKIGSSDNIKRRAYELPHEFGSMVILKVFECSQYIQFEKFLHNHSTIVKTKYRDVVFENHTSTEVFKMTLKDYEEAVRIAKHHIHRYQSAATVDKLIEYEMLRKENNEAESSGGVTEEPFLLDVSNERKYTQSRGYKIQRYSPDGKILLKTYPGCAEVSRDTNVDNARPKQMKMAAEGRTLYKRFRWAFLDRSLPDDTVQDIGETVESKTVQKGFVAMLNLDKTKIINVFCDMTAASEDRHFKNVAPVSKAVNKGTQSGGHYFMMWYDCPEILRTEYLIGNILPEPRTPSNGRPIEQLHPITDEVIKRFSSVSHVQKEMRIARISLNSAIENGTVIKGAKWRFV